MTIPLSRLRHAPLLTGLAAYGVGEIVSRIARIAAIAVIARQVSPGAMGTAALATSLFELIRVLANAGIGQAIIAAPDRDLAATCRSARRLFGLWCTLVALIQLAAAAILALCFAQREAGALLAVLSAVYLMMPAGLVPVFLLMREGRTAATARIATTQTVAEHLLSLVLALIWPAAVALVLPKLLTVPVWLIGVRRARPWTPDREAGSVPLRHFARYGAGILGTELAAAARAQIDKLVIGAMLGTQALGFWYFAFGAGLGITNSIVSALSIVLLPHLCGARDAADRARRLRAGCMLALTALLPLVLLQIGLSHWYVPVVFGARWAAKAPLVALLGLGALPMILASLATAVLRATGRTGRDAAIGSAATVAALAGLIVGAHFGLAGAATGYVAGLWLTLVPATLFTLRPIRGGSFPTPLKEAFA